MHGRSFVGVENLTHTPFCPFTVIGGNHDLEGIDEFKTDKQNLDLFMKAHGKPTPQFCREIADKTLLVGLCSTIFREAPYTSHEVIIDQEQIDWFEDLLISKPADEGWKIFVFTHAVRTCFLLYRIFIVSCRVMDAGCRRKCLC